MRLTPNERTSLHHVRNTIESLAAYLNGRNLPDVEASAGEWYAYLSAMKAIVGNASNALSFVATLMAEEYLCGALGMESFDAAAKAMGASGLDIDELTLDNKRVIGEIKTTTPFLEHDLGAAQKTAFKKDFAKLNGTPADHKFFFVTDERAFRIVVSKYAHHIPDVTIVLLPTGEEHTFRPANTP